MTRHEQPTGSFEDSVPPHEAEAADAARGTTFGRYKIITLLGEGGFGSVYLAEQSAPVKRRVALKLIKPGMDSRSVIARFEAERQVLALLDHPSVAKVYDAGPTPEGRPYIAMELVRGEPITRYCELERVSIVDRVRLMMQVCGAVQHAHMKGVLHRDLKPSNILVASVDGSPLPKIIDFGVAKALHQRIGDSTIYTEMGQMIGTPDYMSPEQARGSADVDTRADIYALGAILYELLTGDPPLDVATRSAHGQAALERAIEEEAPTPPSKRLAEIAKADRPSSLRGTDAPSTVKEVRGDLDWIVLKCLEKERSRRYHSAAALADDLERYLNDEPVLAGPPSTAYLAAKFVKRHRVAVTAAVIVALTIALGVAGIALALGRAMQEAAAAQQAREESEAVTAFLTQMIQSVDPDEAGRDVTVRQVLDRASSDLASFADRPIIEARLRHALGVSYWHLGRLGEADEHLAAAVELRRKALGDDHIDTLRALSNVGGLRIEQGRFAEAVETLRSALDGFSRSLGEDHALALGVASNLAVVYSRRGLDNEALKMSERVYEGQRRALGPTHPHTLGALSNWASQLAEIGRMQEAEPLLREAVARWKTAHGAEKPGTLNALHALANLMRSAGRLDEAHEVMSGVVEARRRVLGEDHLDTLVALANLGLIQRDGGRIDDAEGTLIAAWEGMRRAIGEAHPTTLRVLAFITDLLERQGWPARGGEFVRAIIEAARAVVEAPDVPANELNNIAYTLIKVEPADARDVPVALALAHKACAEERSNGGDDLWMYLDTLASAQHAAGLFAEALASQREALRLVPPAGERFLDEMLERERTYEAAARGG